MKKIKADDLVKYDDDLTGDYTYFQELDARVEVLQETVDELVAILKSNGLHRVKRIDAEYFNMDKVYELLENN